MDINDFIDKLDYSLSINSNNNDESNESNTTNESSLEEIIKDSDEVIKDSDEIIKDSDEIIKDSDEIIKDSDEVIEGGNSKSRSILTFNASVSNKKVISDLESVPFQIMATTRNYLTKAMISNYPETHNPNLLLHMNYITRPFNDNAIETNSRERASLRQYALLAQRTGTHDILIHMPANLTEYINMAQGFRVISDELIKQNMVVHLEIAPWTQELINHLKLQENPQVVVEFLDKVISRFNKFPKDSFKIVFDTAHLYALGYEAEEQIKLFHKYRQYMKYCHLNGNVNAKYTSDSHAPIMSSKSKIKNWELLSAEIAKMDLICIAEITKFGKQWGEWEDYAKKFKFQLIPYHEQLCF